MQSRASTPNRTAPLQTGNLKARHRLTQYSHHHDLEFQSVRPPLLQQHRLHQTSSIGGGKPKYAASPHRETPKGHLLLRLSHRHLLTSVHSYCLEGPGPGPVEAQWPERDLTVWKPQPQRSMPEPDGGQHSRTVLTPSPSRLAGTEESLPRVRGRAAQRASGPQAVDSSDERFPIGKDVRAGSEHPACSAGARRYEVAYANCQSESRCRPAPAP